MALEEIKKQTMFLHQAIMMLELQYRLEAIDFLSDCCNDLRLKTLTYQDIESDHVLNLTMSQKEYIPFTGDFKNEDRFVDLHSTPFGNPAGSPLPLDAHKYDYGDMEYIDIDEVHDTLKKHWEPPAEAWGARLSEPANPVNLVMSGKDDFFKKNRRKQMFTRKSGRPVAENAVANEEKKISQRENEIDSGPMSCRKCCSRFLNMLHFNKHKSSCKKKLTFSCKFCGDKFRFETHYRKHLAGHKQNDCKLCPKRFSSKSKYRKHLKLVHPECKDESDAIPCKFCPMQFPRLNRLYSHYQLHHSKGKFVCTVCGLFLSSKEKHKEHMVDHDKDKKWACTSCGKKFYLKHTLKKHMKIHNAGLYRCLTCETTVGSKVELTVHKKKNHEVVGLEPRYECDICHKKFPKKWLLERHLASHSKEKKFACKFCDKMFGTASGLSEHKKRNTHFTKVKCEAPESKYEKIYQDNLICESCGKQYKTYCQLNSHLKIHISVYSCDICGTVFNLKSNLRRHMKNHTSGRQAVCELCGDSFARVQGLREHTFIKHSDIRQVPCSVCSKTFKRRSELNRHMRVHDMIRSYVCFCGRAYKQSAHLRSHQKSTHASDPLLLPEPSPAPPTDHPPLLSLGHFDDRDYKLPEAVVNYEEDIGYGSVGFADQTAVSPAVDLTMVSMAEATKQEPEAAMPLVNLSERIVQEYLLNLP